MFLGDTMPANTGWWLCPPWDFCLSAAHIALTSLCKRLRGLKSCPDGSGMWFSCSTQIFFRIPSSRDGTHPSPLGCHQRFAAHWKKCELCLQGLKLVLYPYLFMSLIFIVISNSNEVAG